jgi:hypothetical protein
MAAAMKLVALLVVVGCIESPMPAGSTRATIVAAWDPLQCGDPHRVAIELADSDGVAISGSTNCAIGSLTLDAAHFGDYRGRIYAWQLGQGARSSEDVELAVDEAIVHWEVATPR